MIQETKYLPLHSESFMEFIIYTCILVSLFLDLPLCYTHAQTLVLKNAEFLVWLCAVKIKKGQDILHILEVLSEVFNPQCRCV